MQVPSEHEYGMMLGRLQNAMTFSCQALAQLADNGAGGNELRKLAKMLERIGNDENDPVPTNLPDASMKIADLPDL